MAELLSSSVNNALTYNCSEARGHLLSSLAQYFIGNIFQSLVNDSRPLPTMLTLEIPERCDCLCAQASTALKIMSNELLTCSVTANHQEAP
jgi:hypothetical protein